MAQWLRDGSLRSNASHVCDTIRRWTGSAPLTLLVVGISPGIDASIAWLVLELGVAVRRVHQVEKLAHVLASYSSALARKPAVQTERFLHGLNARDVRFNKSAPKEEAAMWVGALRQLLPDVASNALHATFPTFRTLYDKFAEGEHAEGEVADLRSGAHRLGPAKTRKIARVLMATREEAMEHV